MAPYKIKKLKNFDIYGVIVCVDKYCKYVVKTASGRILLRNRKLIRKHVPASFYFIFLFLLTINYSACRNKDCE